MLISGIITLITLITFAIGGLLNGLEIWLIVFHSPKGMRVYRQILLQISAADVLTLVIALLTQPVSDLKAIQRMATFSYGNKNKQKFLGLLKF